MRAAALPSTGRREPFPPRRYFGAAYFTGKPEEKKEGGEAPKSAELEKLEKEIAARKESK